MYKVVSLFAGAGGMDLGLEQAGMKVIWANDIDSDSCKTYRMWSDAVVVQGDIAQIDFTTIPNADVIVGGFPCQGFSLAGPRRLNDERNALYKHFVWAVAEKKPYAFIAENVKGILTLGKGIILEIIVNNLEALGYNVTYKLLNAADYGVPQHRERVFFVGLRKDLNTTFSFPEPSPHRVTLRDALGCLDEPSPEDVCSAPYSSRYMSRNRRRGWDELSYTIPAMAKQVPLHPSSPPMIRLGKDSWKFGEGITRRFSWQEAALIQTFPEGMQFAGDLTSKYRQIGNAVPVRLAKAIGEALVQALDKHFSCIPLGKVGS
jgi:DNA (cytosine-5)-methyltransferase 1